MSRSVNRHANFGLHQERCVFRQIAFLSRRIRKNLYRYDHAQVRARACRQDHAVQFDRFIKIRFQLALQGGHHDGYGGLALLHGENSDWSVVVFQLA